MNKSIKAKREFAHKLFARLHEDNPHPQGELNWTNPYTLLVAVALSAQATDIGVNKATKTLFEIVDSPQAMLDLGEEALISHIKSIGLYRTKAANIMKTSAILTQQHHGQVPQNREALEALPGIGRKTANVVLHIAFGKP